MRTPFVPARLPLHLDPAPFAHARGPAAVERVVRGGAIRWLARREPRGGPVPPTIHHLVGVLPTALFARLVAPDQTAPERMVVSVVPAANAGRHFRNKLLVCSEVVGGRYGHGGGGCWHAGRLFSTMPFEVGVLGSRGEQFVTLAGLASDDVARLELFLATGEHVRVSLHDNAFVAEASVAKYPLRLVAYDAERRVIGVKTLKGDWQSAPHAQPAANARWRTVARLGGATVMTAPSTEDGLCVATRTARGAGSMGCGPRHLPPRAVDLGVVDGIVAGRVGAAVSRVRVRFRDGGSVTVPVRGAYVLARVPAGRRVASITAG
jgi:hypothetical protein